MGGRSSQITVEVLKTVAPVARASQLVVEVLKQAGPQARVSQFFIEVLIVNLEKAVLPVFPVLPGLTFDVSWTPMFAAMPTQITSTMANIDLALSDTPIHEFDLVYDFLRDGSLQNTGSSEFKTMMGFFLRIGGTAGRFFFKNPDDYVVTAQPIATTDGAKTTYTITRTFGVAPNVGTEPVGGVDMAQTHNMYLDGVLQGTGTYDWLTDQPGIQQIKFHSTPAAGQVVTVDCTYWYYCKFPDGNTVFKKFLDKVWNAGSIKLRSCLAGA